ILVFCLQSIDFRLRRPHHERACRNPDHLQADAVGDRLELVFGLDLFLLRLPAREHRHCCEGSEEAAKEKKRTHRHGRASFAVITRVVRSGIIVAAPTRNACQKPYHLTMRSPELRWTATRENRRSVLPSVPGI